MLTLNRLWNDEGGAVLAAETVLVGSIAALGAVVGLNAVSTSLNDELKEVAIAIRSLDQSYSIPAQKSCNAWTAGSSYAQPPVAESVQLLKTKLDTVPIEAKPAAPASPSAPASSDVEKTVPATKLETKELPKAPQEEPKLRYRPLNPDSKSKRPASESNRPSGFLERELRSGSAV